MRHRGRRSLPQFADDRRHRNGRRDAGGMGAVELLPDRTQLALLELSDREAALAVGCLENCRIQQFEHWALAESVGHDLGTASRLQEESLKQIGRAVRANFDDLGVTLTHLRRYARLLTDAILNQSPTNPMLRSTPTAPMATSALVVSMLAVQIDQGWVQLGLIMILSRAS